jgi:PTH1 family peptidyl-tRNA hydrolase
MAELKLIVGLGNPGARYSTTRHNVGEVWVRHLAQRFGITLNPESKFKGEIGRGEIDGVDLRLLIPDTFMNLSGEAVGAVQRFYKLETAQMLVAYDEMAFEPGVVRIREGGGDNGHNGLKSVRAGCGNDGDFVRLRIGVGHPGRKELVTAYLTQHTMPQGERALVEQALDFSNRVLADVVHGRWQEAMNVIHATPEPIEKGQ